MFKENQRFLIFTNFWPSKNINVCNYRQYVKEIPSTLKREIIVPRSKNSISTKYFLFQFTQYNHIPHQCLSFGFRHQPLMMNKWYKSNDLSQELSIGTKAKGSWET